MKTMKAITILFCIVGITGTAWADPYWGADGNDVFSLFSGNCGIGTEHPQAKLNVMGDVQIEAPSFFTPILSKNGTINPGIDLDLILCSPVWTRLISGPGCDAGIAMTTGGMGVNTWKIYRDGPSSNLHVREVMTYDPYHIHAMTVEHLTGNVGIHEADPIAPLHVTKAGEGGQVAAYFINPEEDVAAEVEIQMAAGTSTGLPPWTWYLNATNGSFSIGSTNVFPATLNLTSSGHLGVGVVSPTYGLQLPNESSNTGKGLAYGWWMYSSRRFKTNIKPIKGALEKVQKLQGVSFDWKDQGKHDIGLIAEDVGTIVPEVVDYEANGKDACSIEYSKLVPLLIEAIKEQQARITELEQVVAANKKLEQRINALERLIQPQQLPSW